MKPNPFGYFRLHPGTPEPHLLVSYLPVAALIILRIVFQGDASTPQWSLDPPRS